MKTLTRATHCNKSTKYVQIKDNLKQECFVMLAGLKVTEMTCFFFMVTHQEGLSSTISPTIISNNNTGK